MKVTDNRKKMFKKTIGSSVFTYSYYYPLTNNRNGRIIIMNNLESKDDEPSVISKEALKLSKTKLEYFRQWHKDGKLHRECGPASIWANGAKFYYLYGEKMKKDQWENEIIKIKLKRLSEL